MLKKLSVLMTFVFILAMSTACAENGKQPGDQGFQDDQTYQGYSSPHQRDMGGFEQNRQDMWGGVTRDRQYGQYDDQGKRGLRQYHRYGERGMWERYGDPMGPRDRTLGYDGRSGLNRDGQAEFNSGRAGTGLDNTFNRADLTMADQMRQRCQNVPGVQDAEVVIHGDDVLVGVQHDRDIDAGQLESQIKSALKGQAKGKEIHVITDDDQVSRLGDINRGIRSGQPMDDFMDDIGDMVRDLGRTVTEPFRR